MHPDERRILDYVRGALSAADLLAVDDHLSGCSDCRARAATLNPLPEAIAELQSSLLPVESHLTDVQLTRHAEGSAGPEERAVVAAHLRECAACAREAHDLRAWASPRRSVSLGWLAAAAALVLLVLTPLALRWWTTAGGVSATPLSLAGLESLPATEQRAIRLSLQDGVVEPPARLADLSSRPEVLMGEPEEGSFRLLEPLGTVVVTDRPSFRWQPLAGAESYTVSVFDEAARRVAESPSLHDTSWTPSEPLERGRVLVWQVRARSGAESLTTPVPPDPPARFRVLEAETAQVLERAAREHPASHLLLGLLYAQAGARTEAERHLGLVEPADPYAEVARRTRERLRP
ncbi:MAG TPA: zf-HC2 domain-containing protein [Vicinamibacteria bacterium]